MRSPFGELLHTHRLNANLTREELVAQINAPRPGIDHATISLRTIAMIERHYQPGETWAMPRVATVRALAAGLGLQPETPEWTAFVAAARESAHPSPEQRASDPEHPGAAHNALTAQVLQTIRADLITMIDDVLARRLGTLLVGVDRSEVDRS